MIASTENTITHPTTQRHMESPPVTRTQYVADVLRERILGGIIAGGQPLTQQSIAEEFNVSRIPVREALLMLQAEGLVELLPHKGAYVTELSRDKITELFELRSLLEVSLLRAAIPNMTHKDLDKAEATLATFDTALNDGASIALWSDFNYAFHTILYAPSGKTETLSLVDILNVRCARYIRMQLVLTQKVHKAQQEHHAMLHACKQKNIEKACNLLHDHIIESSSSITQLLDKELLKNSDNN